MNYFQETKAFIHGNSALRDPQWRAYSALKKSFKNDLDSHKIIVLPTGTGKTGLIAISPYGIANGRVLVITPSLIIREGISDEFDTRVVSNFWTRNNVIIDDNNLPSVYRYTGFSTAGEKKRAQKQLDDANIVIANIHKVSQRNSKASLARFLPEDYFDMVIIDEAHHSAADSWIETLKHFNAKKIVKLTATPIRADNKVIEGEITYEFKLSDAINEGFVKNVVAEDYTNEKLEFLVDDKYVDKETALDLMDDKWVSRTVAYSPKCNETIVDMSIERLNEKRKHGKAHHQIIAVACGIEHAKQIKEIYESKGLKADYVSADRQDESEQVIIDFKKGLLDVVVNINILGEGFDHPNISIAAIFRPYRSLPPYAQFIGRSLRRITGDEIIDDIDNIAHVIYHTELDIDDLWHFYSGEEEKAKRKKELDRIYNADIVRERNVETGEVEASGEIIKGVKEFLSDGIGHKYADSIKFYIRKIEKNLDDQANKLRESGFSEQDIESFITNKRRELDEGVNSKVESLRSELIREELHSLHKADILERVHKALTTYSLEPKASDLPSNTTNPMLKNLKTNEAYMIKFFNMNLKNRLRRSIDGWETFDFEQAREIIPELNEKLNEKCERVTR